MDRWGKKCGNEGSSYGRRVLAENLRKLLRPERGTPVDHNSKIAGKIKAQITRFAHKISGGYKKPLRKWMIQMFYGSKPARM